MGLSRGSTTYVSEATSWVNINKLLLDLLGHRNILDYSENNYDVCWSYSLVATNLYLFHSEKVLLFPHLFDQTKAFIERSTKWWETRKCCLTFTQQCQIENVQCITYLYARIEKKYSFSWTMLHIQSAILTIYLPNNVQTANVVCRILFAVYVKLEKFVLYLLMNHLYKYFVDCPLYYIL